jgi:hypothetical protein
MKLDACELLSSVAATTFVPIATHDPLAGHARPMMEFAPVVGPTTFSGPHTP